ncbi:peptide chain release factor N(5)-glutamine methyltransferase [soil metagenome]
MSAGTVREALEAATDGLRAAAIDSPQLDAELLLAEATGSDRAAMISRPDAPIEAADARRFGEMMRRRLRREPVAYILGRKGFRRIDLTVDSRSLIPRPETELLVEIALEREQLSVLEVGTGSGAIALAVADELPLAEVVATDTSPGALAVAAANARALGLAERVSFEECSLPATGSFDLLLSNLPYVTEKEWKGLEPELREFEPYEALVAGPTGLETIDAVIGALSLADDLRAQTVAFEVGEGQASSVAEILRRAGYETVSTRRDLAGIERVVIGELG